MKIKSAIGIRRTTVELTNDVTTVDFGHDYKYFAIRNDGSGSIYVSTANKECTAGEDEVVLVPSGSSYVHYNGYGGNTGIYLSGTGTATVVAQDDGNNPFKGAQGGGDYAVAGASSYTLNNAVDYPLLALNLYGKSTQDGVPTPEAPVDIVSVGDSGSVEVKACGKNIFPWNDYTTAPINSWGNSSGGKFRLSSSEIQLDVDPNTASVGGGLFIWKAKYFTDIISPYYGNSVTISYELKSDSEIVVIHGFEAEKVSDLVNNTWKRYSCTRMFNNFNDATNICWKTINQPETILYIRKIQLEIGDTATDYEPYKGATANITTALPLCGIPVDSDGNYTDSNGQQWICDELIYNADGSGKIVKRTNGIIFNGSENWKLSEGNKKRIFVSVADNLTPKFKSNVAKAYLFSNKYIAGSDADTFNVKKTCISISKDFDFHIYDERFPGDVDGLKADMAANNLRVVYALKTPQEIELTSAEMAVLRELQTFNGITNISNDSGADMDVKLCTNKALSEYVFPITTGLQKQIDELKAAVISLGGNV